MPRQDAAWLDCSLLLREVYNGTDEDLNFEQTRIDYRDRPPVPVEKRSHRRGVSQIVNLPEPDFATLSTKELERLANAISPHVAGDVDPAELNFIRAGRYRVA